MSPFWDWEGCLNWGQDPVMGNNVTQMGGKSGDTILNILLAGRKRF